MKGCDHCDQRLIRIESDIQSILTILETISVTNVNIEKSCRHMDTHIGFVDNVYQKVQEPLTWVVNRIGFRRTLPDMVDAPTMNDTDRNS